MATRSYIQFRDQLGNRWKHGEVDTDLARELAQRVVELGVQEGVAIALVHIDPDTRVGEHKIEPVQIPGWVRCDVRDDAASVRFFVQGAAT